MRIKIKLVFIIFTLLTTTINAQDDVYFENCLKQFSEVQNYLNENKKDNNKYCLSQAKFNTLWIKSGKPTIFLNSKGCKYLNSESSTLKKCLPSRFYENIMAIKVSANKNTDYKFIIETVNEVKSRGIEEVMFETTP